MFSLKYGTDARWGCMLRCGQNIFAESLKRHVKQKLVQKIISEIKQIQQKNKEKIPKNFSIQQQFEQQNGLQSIPQKCNYNVNAIFQQDKDQYSQEQINFQKGKYKLNKQQKQQFEKIYADILKCFSDNITLDGDNIGQIQEEFYQIYDKNFNFKKDLKSQDNQSEKFQKEQIDDKNSNNTKILDINDICQEQIRQQKEQNKQVKLKRVNDLNKIIGKYSIQRISYLSYNEFNLRPGEWYQPTQIMYILQCLHEIHPYEYAQDFKIMSLNCDQIISFEEILQAMTGQKDAKMCENPEHLNQKIQKYDSNNNKYIIGKDQNIFCDICHETKYSIGLYINARIGLDTPDPQYLNQVMQLMKCPLNLGIIGGRGKKAHYFVGNQLYI
ncbi:hypothetical protein PPERSA_10030 [Pseudocohnilembus persalinus]|uniref:Cysteine protease n=1 Tax=Pseudocohnilembus persalinus TaxID=266149 RepID=A0A0V0QJF9_PSEPJ|nr:hypothetical protein PPERSA_10030 [Pseudocohnilembus persalinus]|eukprot:KRX02413.1 hypothetical protein PPERSA_10030 [Pseudocohnilembus persalinus]